MADPTAVTRGKRWEAYHWGFGRLQTARGNARHPKGHLGSRSTRAFHTFAATPPLTSAKKEERKKFFASTSLAPSPPSRPQGQRLSACRGAARAEGTRPRSRGAAGAAAGRPRAARGMGSGRAAESRGLLGLPGPRAGRQVSGAAQLHPRCAAAPPLAAQGRGDPEERRRPPRPRTPGCSQTGEGRAASSEPLHNRRLPQGT